MIIYLHIKRALIIIYWIFRVFFESILFRIITTYKHLNIFTDRENRKLYFRHVWKLLKRLPKHLFYTYLFISYVDIFLSVDYKDYITIALTYQWTDEIKEYWAALHWKKIRILIISIFFVYFGAWFFLRRTYLYFVSTTFIIPGMFFSIVYKHHADMFVWAAHVLQYSLVSYYIYAFVWYWPHIIIAFEEQEQEDIDLQFDRGNGQRLVNGKIVDEFPIDKYDSIYKFLIAEILGPYIKPETGIEAPEHFGARWRQYEKDVEALLKRDEREREHLAKFDAGEHVFTEEESLIGMQDVRAALEEIREDIRAGRPTTIVFMLYEIFRIDSFFGIFRCIKKIFILLAFKYGAKNFYMGYFIPYLYWYKFAIWKTYAYLSFLVRLPKPIFRLIQYIWMIVLRKRAVWRKNGWVLAVGPFEYLDKPFSPWTWKRVIKATRGKPKKPRIKLKKKYEGLEPLKPRTYKWHFKHKKLAISLFEKNTDNNIEKNI